LSEVAIKRSDDMYIVKCPHCGAEYRIPVNLRYATCPYCGTTIAIDRRVVEENHYLFRVYIDGNKAYRLAVEFAGQQWNSPGDLASKAVYESAKLHYVPIYVYSISYSVMTADQRVREILGGTDTVLERYVAEIAISSPVIPIHPRYSFPVRGRDKFKPVSGKTAVFHRPERDPYKILTELKKRYYSEALGLLRSIGVEAEVIDSSRYEGVAHYPFWEIIYRVDGNRYRAFVDATDGTIVYVEYPLSFTGRVLSLTASAIIFIGTAALGLGVGMLMHHTIIGLVGGVLSGLPAYKALYGSAKRRIGKYIFNPEEEGLFAPVR